MQEIIKNAEKKKKKKNRTTKEKKKNRMSRKKSDEERDTLEMSISRKVKNRHRIEVKKLHNWPKEFYTLATPLDGNSIVEATALGVEIFGFQKGIEWK